MNVLLTPGVSELEYCPNCTASVLKMEMVLCGLSATQEQEYISLALGEGSIFPLVMGVAGVGEGQEQEGVEGTLVQMGGEPRKLLLSFSNSTVLCPT